MRKLLFVILLAVATSYPQTTPPIEPGVSHDLAIWRAARYSDVRYKLDLTLEKMSPLLKGTIEIRVKVSTPGADARKFDDGATGGAMPAQGEPVDGSMPPIVLDWRKIAGHEKDSTISNVTLNGVALSVSPLLTRGLAQPDATNDAQARASARAISGTLTYDEHAEHLIFANGVKPGENVIKLDFTSPILTSGSAITRYIDKEDGSEYIYSLFVPSDASTAFPVFDQPDLKARFTLSMTVPSSWRTVSNTSLPNDLKSKYKRWLSNDIVGWGRTLTEIEGPATDQFPETKPLSTYVFAFAAGPFVNVADGGKTTASDVDVCPPDTICDPIITAEQIERLPIKTKKGASTTKTDKAGSDVGGTRRGDRSTNGPPAYAGGSDKTALATSIYVRKSQAAKFQPHAAEVFRLMREDVKYLEEYFDYKFPFPKYDLVLIPEFPFGGMEHAGATFVRESAIIFPTEPTKSDEISRAVLLFHETAHQWFGDTVTMKWFDDLWLKEGFANFMAYKALEKIMPEANAWKVFYERIKQPAYATDSTRGTTPIYQPIENLSAAKSAYGNIVYNKAPAFLRQAEFYLGEDKFQTAVRAFLKKHEYGNATWEDLVKEFEGDSSIRPAGNSLGVWAQSWVTERGLEVVAIKRINSDLPSVFFTQRNVLGEDPSWKQRLKSLKINGSSRVIDDDVWLGANELPTTHIEPNNLAIIPNYGDYGYGIFLLDDKSRDYVLKNVQNEKDPFLRSMMYGALWDSVREGEFDPKVYVETVLNALDVQSASLSLSSSPRKTQAKACTLNCGETDETIIQSLVGRVSVALNYYLPATDSSRSRFEAVLFERMQHAETASERVTFFRAYLNNASTEKGRAVLKQMLEVSVPPGTVSGTKTPPHGTFTLRAKDKFDIVTRLAIIGDPDAAKILAGLERSETGDDAKRYAYAAHAAFATKENREKYWNDFVSNKDISESWIEAAIQPFNSISHSELSLPYLERALAELPNLKRTRKIFFINNWLGAWIGGQKSQASLDIVNKFLADNPNLDKDLRLKILENVDIIERAVKIRSKFGG